MKPETRNPPAETFVIIILALLPLLFFWRIITFNPADRMAIKAGDFTEQYFPLRAFSATEWAAGRAPLWNPALFGGMPALADIQSGALYPPHVLQALVLGRLGKGFPLSALEWQAILHFSLAAIGAYLLGRYWARRAGAGRRAARLMGLVVSVTFTYSGYLTGFPVQQLTILLTSAWLPWVMWTLARTFDAVADGLPLPVSLARAGWASAAFAMSILAGHPQTAMYIFYLMAAYGLFQIQNSKFKIQNGKPESPIANVAHRALRIIIHGVVIVALGSLMAAAQLLPTLQFISRSLRADLSFGDVSQGLPLSELVSVLYPGYFGGSPEYGGVFLLLLVAAALVLGRPLWRGRIFFWLGVALLSLALAFGANTFVYPFAYLALPGFDAVRRPERVFLLYSFSMAVLAGYGALALAMPFPKPMQSTWKKFERNARRVGAVALALTGLFVYGAVAANIRGDDPNLFNGVLRHHIFGLIIYAGALLLPALRPRRLWRRGWGVALIAGWLVFNLFTVNWQFNLERRPPAEPFTPVGVSRFVIERVAALPQPARISGGGLLPGGNNTASVYHLEDITGNTPLQLADVAAFAGQMPAWRFWQLMNVRYVVDERDIDGPGLIRRFEADGLKVYEVGDPFPRAWLVHRVLRGDDWAALAADETDLKTTALLPATGKIGPLSEPGGASAAVVVEPAPGRLAVDVAAAGDGLLVLSNIFYPGWQATLDGQPVEIIRADGILQGVFVPAGAHRVTLAYKPRTVRWGSWLSVGGLLLAAGLIFRKKQ